MKSIITFIIFGILLPFTTQAQNWVQEPVDVPVSVFPILGMPFGIGFEETSPNILLEKPNIFKQIGINGFYEPKIIGFKYSTPYHTNGMKSYLAIRDLEEKQVSGQDFFGHYEVGFKATESRFFLASDESALTDADVLDYETRANWKWVTGNEYIKPEPLLLQASARTFEAEFGDEAGNDNPDHYILKYLDTYPEADNTNLDNVSNARDWYVDENTRRFTIANANRFQTIKIGDDYVPTVRYTDKAHCGFIYRLEDQATVANGYDFNADGEVTEAERNEAVYKLHYKVYLFRSANSDHSVTEDLDVIDLPVQEISWNNYHNDVIPSHEPKSLTLFPYNVEKYPGIKQASPTQNSYSIRYQTIDLKDIIDTKNSGLVHAWDKYEVRRIDCWVQRIKPIKIWVRGLRIRSDQAQLVLSKDITTVNTIKQFFLDKKTELQSITNGNVSAWDNTIGFMFGNEPIGPTFRVLAEIDKLCNQTLRAHAHSEIHIAPFVANNKTESTKWSHYRVIYEDQIGLIPPPLTAENLEFFHEKALHPSIDHLPYPKDAIDYKLRTHADFFKADVPLTGDLLSDFDEMPTTSLYDYTLYTNRIQARFENSAQTCFCNAAKYSSPSYAGTNPSLTSKFYAHLSTIQSLALHRIPVQSSFRESVASRLKTSPPTDCTLNDVIPQVVGIKEVSGENSSEWEKYIITGYRSPLPSELRLQAWNAFCHGAKGIIFNTIGVDGGANQGLCDYDYNFDYNYEPGFFQSQSSYSKNYLFSNPLIGTFSAPVIKASDQLSSQNESYNYHSVYYDSPETLPQNMTKDQYLPFFWDDDNDSQTDDVFLNSSDISIYLSSMKDRVGATIPTLIDKWWDDKFEFEDKVVGGNWGSSATDFALWKPRMIDTKDDAGVTVSVWEARMGLNYYGPKLNQSIGTGCYHLARNTKYPYTNSISRSLAAPMYYGIKDRWEGAKRVVDDVKPIASTLADLIWIDAASYSSTEFLSTGSFGSQKYPIQSYLTKETGGSDNTSQLITANDRYTYTTDGSNPDHFSFTSFEDKSVSLYHLGLLTGPNEDAQYLVIVNKRTWPVRFRYDDGQHPERVTGIYQNDPTYAGSNAVADGARLEGAIDVRRFTFRINRSAFTNGNDIAHFTITNLRTGRESLIEWGKKNGNGDYIDTFSTVFEPGEGTLLKISPAYSIVLGESSDSGMAYNNGHRIAMLGDPQQLSQRPKIVVWEKEGRIQYNITNTPAPMSALENFVPNENNQGFTIPDPPSPITLSPDIVLSNPSVAAKDNNIYVVYSYEDRNPSMLNQPESRKVIGHWGIFDPNSGAVNWQIVAPRIHDDAVPRDVNQPSHKMTPVVTSGSNNFMVAWSNSDNPGVPVVGNHYIQVEVIALNSNGDGIDVFDSKMVQAEANVAIISEVFPSLASRSEFDAQDGFGNSLLTERYHLAWQADWTGNTSQIYYTYFDLNTSGILTSGPIERVSKMVTGCIHQHPNIAVLNARKVDEFSNSVKVRGEPVVTWERVQSILDTKSAGQNPQQLPPSGITQIIPKGRSVLLRYRLPFNGFWGSVSTIDPIKDNLPLPLVSSGIYEYSQESPAVFLYPVKSITTFVTYMDSIKKLIKTASNLSDLGSVAAPIFLWSHKLLVDRGMYPNLGMNYINSSQPVFPVTADQVNTLTLRGIHTIFHEDDILYHARVTAPTLNEVLTKDETIKPVKTINAISKNTCKQKFAFTIGTPNLNPAIWCTGCPDTIYFNTGSGIPIWFDNYDITNTRPGYYSESDTTIFNWPRTEDSVRTENFEYDLGDTLSFDRMFYMEDTAWVKTLINNSTLGNINYSVLLKDSASGQTIATLDQITIDTASIDIAVKRFGEDNITSVSAFLPPMPSPTSFYVPQGPGRKVQWIANAPSPSGKAYITIHASKDEDMPVVMSQEHGEYDNFDVIIPMIDTVAFKQAGQQPASQSVSTTPVTLSINPNPFEGSTRVTVETVKDVPLSVQVYNVLGGLVADLYNEMSKQTHYEFTLDSKTIRPGTYFIRAQAGNGIITKKVQFVK